MGRLTIGADVATAWRRRTSTRTRRRSRRSDRHRRGRRSRRLVRARHGRPRRPPHARARGGLPVRERSRQRCRTACTGTCCGCITRSSKACDAPFGWLPTLASVGVDGWGVDYGLLDPAGRLLGNPYHYRDGRTAAGVERVHAARARGSACTRGPAPSSCRSTPSTSWRPPWGRRSSKRRTRFFSIPDLIGYWLAGGIRAEATNASTTGLFDPVAGSWALDLVRELGLPAAILPDLVHAGDPLGAIRPEVIAETGLSRDAVLTAVGSHDTASAVVGVPAEDERFAYISCGTWALVGVELGAPILRGGRASRRTSPTSWAWTAGSATSGT